MDLSISGKVIHVLEEQSGQGKNGTWRKRDFVVETQDNFPKKICMTQWGDEIDNSGLQVGDAVKVGIDVQSREYNGRWYTDVKAWKVEKEQAAGANLPPSMSNDGDPGPAEPPFLDDDDDLPF